MTRTRGDAGFASDSNRRVREGMRAAAPLRSSMGLFDSIKNALGSGVGSASPAGAGVSSSSATLADAQRRRRDAPDMRRRDGNPRSFRGYERLERIIFSGVNRFPWSETEAVAMLERANIPRAAAERYLASPAARKLMGR